MDKDELIMIISDHYESILKSIEDQEKVIKLKEESYENNDFVGSIIKKDKSEFIAELKEARDANIEQLDLKFGLINSISRDESIENEEKFKKIKKIIFENKFCFFVNDEYLIKNFSKYLGALFSLPFYLEENEVDKIRLKNFKYNFFLN